MEEGKLKNQITFLNLNFIKIMIRCQYCSSKNIAFTYGFSYFMICINAVYGLRDGYNIGRMEIILEVGWRKNKEKISLKLVRLICTTSLSISLLISLFFSASNLSLISTFYFHLLYDFFKMKITNILCLQKYIFDFFFTSIY